MSNQLSISNCLWLAIYVELSMLLSDRSFYAINLVLTFSGWNAWWDMLILLSIYRGHCILKVCYVMICYVCFSCYAYHITLSSCDGGWRYSHVGKDMGREGNEESETADECG